MTLGLTYAELKALRPCAERLATIRKMMGGARKWTSPVTAAQARKRGATLDDIMWAASMVARSNLDVERRLRLWLADCVAHVLHIYERKYPADDRPREAIITSRAFARGEINAAARDAACDAARDAAWDAEMDTAAWNAARAASGAARAANAAWDAAASNAAWAAARAASDAARATERRWQYDRLVLWLGEDEPEDWPLPARQEKQDRHVESSCT